MSKILYYGNEDLTAREKLALLSAERKEILKTIADELKQSIEEVTEHMGVPLKIHVDYETYLVKSFDIEVTDDGALELDFYETD